MTQVDYFADALEITGLQHNIEKSCPPDDIRLGSRGEFSFSSATGRYEISGPIKVDNTTVVGMRGPLNELSEAKKKNGGGDYLTTLKEVARETVEGIIEAEADGDGELDEEEREERRKDLRRFGLGAIILEIDYWKEPADPAAEATEAGSITEALDERPKSEPATTAAEPISDTPHKFLQRLRPGGPWLLIAIVPDGKPTGIAAYTAEEVE